MVCKCFVKYVWSTDLQDSAESIRFTGMQTIMYISN